MPSANEYIGSSLDELLAADGTLAEAEKVARERIHMMERGAMVATATPTSAESQIEADSGNSSKLPVNRGTSRMEQCSRIPVNQHKK